MAYRTAPTETAGMPPGIPYIVGNEAAERFTFYGLRGVLIIFMTQYLLDRSGAKAAMTEEDAKGWYHLFVGSAYFFPMLGSIISDGLWGKYATIIRFSCIYTLGCLAFAADQTRLGLFLGLGLIAIGSGGIKPCVSAHVGDQFGRANAHLLPKAFGWFYFSINSGSSFSTWFVPIWLHEYGPRVAFGVPAALMAVATFVFWLGRNKFIHVPPAGIGFVRETFSREGLKTVGSLAAIYAFVIVFWMLWDQNSGAWVLQAKHLDLNLLGYKLQAEQVQTANPVLVLLFIPLFSYVIYPAINKIFPLTALRKIGIGLWVTAFSFVVISVIEMRIQSGARPSVWWQILAHAILASGEIMVSITCLEFSYTQSPKKMKSLIMAVFFLSISLGNYVTSAVNFLIQNPDGTSKLPGSTYYWFFTGLMAVAAFLFMFVARRYVVKTYTQDSPDG